MVLPFFPQVFSRSSFTMKTLAMKIQWLAEDIQLDGDMTRSFFFGGFLQWETSKSSKLLVINGKKPMVWGTYISGTPHMGGQQNGSVWKYSNGKVNWDKCWWTMKVWGALVSIRETSCANWCVARFNDSSPSCLWRFQFTVFLCFVLNGLVSN